MRAVLAVILSLLWFAPASAAGWAIAAEETFVLVDVGYITGGKVTIRFDGVGGDIDFNPRRPVNTQAHVVVQSASARSGLALLDPVVHGKGFLNVRQFPTIEFDFDKLVQTGPSDAEIFGQITVFGITRPLKMQARVVKFRPEEPDQADRIISFNLAGEIDRREFGNATQSGLIKSLLPIRIRLTLRPDP